MEICVDLIALNDVVRHAGDDTFIKVATKLDSDRNTVSSVLKGKIKPSSTFMYKFVEAYGVEPELAGKIFFYQQLTQ